jgi:lipopolysaccharide/colanic/teichoic acid biosynthesis glycosyltransferase
MDGMVKGPSIDSSLQPASISKKSLLVHSLTMIFGLTLTGLIIYGLSLPFTNLSLSAPQLSNVLYGSLISYLISSITLHNLGRFPGNRPLSYLLPVVAVYMLIMSAVIIFTRLDYSRTALLISWIVLPVITYLEFRLRQKFQKGRYAVIPHGFYKRLIECNPKKFVALDSPSLEYSDIIGIIVDSNEQLPAEWQQFIADQLSKDTPVIDSVSAYESITGKSPLDHYGELAGHDLLPSQAYLAAKRIFESALIISTAPLTLPFVALIAISVKLESKGPAFFVQRRIGKGGQEFSMYKIRSMRTDSEANGAQFAGEDDPRITRIGKFIRKMRIDELPQFLNILKGDMALIGPRPEQAAFVQEFEKVIPLYSFRHIVRPGITGWAQVTHGYAADEDETREKLAHDFYYVKNLSIWLDLDIVFKTIKTMLTGFGAR